MRGSPQHKTQMEWRLHMSLSNTYVQDMVQLLEEDGPDTQLLFQLCWRVPQIEVLMERGNCFLLETAKRGIRKRRGSVSLTLKDILRKAGKISINKSSWWKPVVLPVAGSCWNRSWVPQSSSSKSFTRPNGGCCWGTYIASGPFVLDHRGILAWSSLMKGP